LLEDFGISISMPTPLLSDSIWAISIARDPVYQFTKYVGVDVILRNHRFRMMLLLFSMYIQSFS
jgi:hypothetical protein